jgi:hypothetical protein
MADKLWYINAGGAQQGPYTEAELRELFARGEVTADTPVGVNPCRAGSRPAKSA